jgi:hypothetical protein
MKASFEVGVLIVFSAVVPLLCQSHTGNGAAASPNAHAIALLHEAATLISEFPAEQRSPALNELSDAWRPLSPQQSCSILRESFALASTSPNDQADKRGEQQVAVVRLMAAQDLSAARELISQMGPLTQGEFTMQHDWRAEAWDQLLQVSLTSHGIASTLQQARMMNGGLADTTALTFLVGQASRQDPQAARDLVSLGVQQFSRQPITIQRFYAFPNVLILLAEIDRPMARRVFETLPGYIPDPPGASEANTQAGKQRIAFRREAIHLLLEKAGRFDPELGYELGTKLGQTPASEGTYAQVDDGTGSDPSGESGREELRDVDAQAQRSLRRAERISRRNPVGAQGLLEAGRSQASSAPDPATRASLYAAIAQTEDRLHDPRASIDLETAMSAIAMAERTATDEAARLHLLNAEMNIMPLILQGLDLQHAEIRARQFSSNVVEFRALMLVANRWRSKTGTLRSAE